MTYRLTEDETINLQERLLSEDPDLADGELIERLNAALGVCPACGSPEATPLGDLGRLTWVRCRDCGIDYHLWPDLGGDQ